MKLLYTPKSINFILTTINLAETSIVIYMGINFRGELLSQIVRILQNRLEKGVKVVYYLEKKFATPAIVYINSILKKYPKFTLTSRSTIQEMDHIKYINIDEKILFIGSMYFADDMLKYHDLMIMFDADNKIDKKYMDYIKPNKPTYNRYVYITQPPKTNTCDDFIKFMEKANYRIVIIMPYICSLGTDMAILSVIKNFYKIMDVTIIQPLKTNTKLFDLLNKMEISGGKYKLNTNSDIKIYYTNEHFHYKNIIIDDTHVLIGTGNINWLNNSIYDINVKFYNKPGMVKEIYQNIGKIMDPDQRVNTIDRWLRSM
jgi:phosphatidylserine/phosphatidylglycerophosphate/cardiolipin synthase-like enzyme